MAQEVARVARRLEEAKETRVLDLEDDDCLITLKSGQPYPESVKTPDLLSEEKEDLSQCELMKIPDAVYLMLKNSVVNKCDLSGNSIKRIPSKFCTKFQALTELQLQGNSLSGLPEEIRDMEELKVLDISSNKFESLPVFYECPKLSTVTAKENKITEIDFERLRKMASLRELDLQDNPLPEEVQQRLKDLHIFTVHIGDSDPVGKELEEVE